MTWKRWWRFSPDSTAREHESRKRISISESLPLEHQGGCASIMPFLGKLEQEGFGITPNRLFQTLTAVGNKSVRFRQVSDTFWNKENIAPAWEKTKQGWHHGVKWLESYGIVTSDILPSDAVFVPG